MESTQVQRKTFNIELRNVRDMESFIAPRKQTAFVNKALKGIIGSDEKGKKQAGSITGFKGFIENEKKHGYERREKLRGTHQGTQGRKSELSLRSSGRIKEIITISL